MTQWLPKILATQQAGIVTYLLKISSMNLRPAAQSESQIINKVHCWVYGQGTESQIKIVLGEIILALHWAGCVDSVSFKLKLHKNFDLVLALEDHLVWAALNNPQFKCHLFLHPPIGRTLKIDMDSKFHKFMNTNLVPALEKIPPCSSCFKQSTLI